MALGSLNDPLQTGVFVLSIIFTPLCIISTVLRFVASKISLGKVGAEDWLALAALLVFLAYIVCVSVVGLYLDGRAYSELTPENQIIALEYTYAANVMFPVQQTFAKLSILFLYHRLFGVNRTFTLWSKIIGVLQLLYCFSTFLASILICIPVHKYWHPLMQEGHCINIAHFLAGVETTNSFIDFAMVFLALTMLLELQTSAWTKFKLGIVFALGGMAGVIGFIKIGFSFRITIDNQIILGLWALIQMAFSIFCCCFIMYKPLLGRAGFFGRLTTRLTSYGSRYGSSSKSSSSRIKDSSQGWIDLEGTRDEAGLVSTEVSVQRNYPDPQAYHDLSTGSGISTPHAGYQMKTVDVRQT